MSDRCQHDMLPGTCAWCKGLPDVPLLDDLAMFDASPVRVGPSNKREQNRIGGESARVVGKCVACNGDIFEGELTVWSPTLGGLLGDCCEGETE